MGCKRAAQIGLAAEILIHRHPRRSDSVRCCAGSGKDGVVRGRDRDASQRVGNRFRASDRLSQNHVIGTRAVALIVRVNRKGQPRISDARNRAATAPVMYFCQSLTEATSNFGATAGDCVCPIATVLVATRNEVSTEVATVMTKPDNRSGRRPLSTPSTSTRGATSPPAPITSAAAPEPPLPATCAATNRWAQAAGVRSIAI
jgi:hypothetical protein